MCLARPLRKHLQQRSRERGADASLCFQNIATTYQALNLALQRTHPGGCRCLISIEVSECSRHAVRCFPSDALSSRRFYLCSHEQRSGYMGGEPRILGNVSTTRRVPLFCRGQLGHGDVNSGYSLPRLVEHLARLRVTKVGETRQTMINMTTTFCTTVACAKAKPARVKYTFLLLLARGNTILGLLAHRRRTPHPNTWSTV